MARSGYRSLESGAVNGFPLPVGDATIASFPTAPAAASTGTPEMNESSPSQPRTAAATLANQIARTSATVSIPGTFSRIVEPWLKPSATL